MSTTLTPPVEAPRTVRLDPGLVRRPRSFRPDIEGLRAIAILAVVAYHVGLPGITGGYVGVDVFFVISGFLITRQLLKEVERTGRISITGFYARRVRRLLPASTLVLVATVLAGWAVLNPLRARDLVRDSLWTLVYSLNWDLAARGTDYLTANAAPSALQHYWSLAVEEQFYLVWPLLMVVACGAWFGRRGGSRRRLAMVLSVVGIASFGLSVWLTSANQPWAYFGLHTRAWELATGALVALAAERFARQFGARLAAGLTWLGVVAIGWSVLRFTDTTTFPGAAAALPVLGAGLVIAGGCAAPRAGAEVVLRRPAMQFFGAMSYGWYLWHWPLLMLTPAWLGRPLATREAALAVLVGLALAWASYRWVEHPIRTASWPTRYPWRGLGLGLGLSAATAAVALLVVSMLPATLGSGTATATGQLSEGEAARAQLHSAMLAGLAVTRVPANLDPALTALGKPGTIPTPQTDGCHLPFNATTVRTDCVYGAVGSPQKVVLFGDSHALQWFPAMEQLAREQGFALVSQTKSSCSPMSLTVWSEALRREYSECSTWRADALRYIGGLRPAQVVVSGMIGVQTHGLYGSEGEFDRAWEQGTVQTVSALRASGARVSVLSDTPYPGRSVPDCLASHLSEADACLLQRVNVELTRARRASEAEAARSAGATVVDTMGWLCSTDRCPVIIGNTLVYRDESHLSTVASRWLAPLLREVVG